MTYSGNPSISAEVQARIRKTFEQTLELAARGNHQEASLGCDFILQLDPQFRPAETLRERLRAGEGAVEVDDLRTALTGRPSAKEQKAEADALFGEGRAAGGADSGTGVFDPLEDLELDDLEDELPELPVGDAAPEADAGDLKSAWQDLLVERRFDEILRQAETAQREVEGDQELARIAATAGERQEAASFVERFLVRARQAADEGDRRGAEELVGKARALDPTHPAIAATEEALGGGGSTAAGAAGAAPTGEPPDLSQADFSGADLSEPDLPEEPTALAAGSVDADLGSGDEEGDRRISELLDEGQAAFDREDYQGAIDAWSRIFLIDIDHGEASRRIEEARRLKSEQERRIEEVFHDAGRALDEGDKEAAEAGLRRVLEMAPGHVAAREQLERLEAGETPPPSPPPSVPAEPPGAPEPEQAEPLREEILVPPDPGAEAAGAVPSDEPAAPQRTMVAKDGGTTSRRFLILGSAVLAVVLVLGYLLLQNWDSFFPNTAESPAGEEDTVDPIARATRLHEVGKTAMAVNQLRRVPPNSSRYEEAQALISQWQAAERKAPAPEASPGEVADQTPMTDSVAQAQRALLDEARAAAAAGEYLRAGALLEQAAQTAPLPEDVESLRSEIEAGAKPLQGSLDLMAMGEYSRALPGLWRMHQDQPDNPDVRRLIADAYYSLALRSLQQGDAATAVDHLEEAVSMEPDDAALQRHLSFARTYADRDKDLLYRIYVKYLPPR